MKRFAVLASNPRALAFAPAVLVAACVMAGVGHAQVIVGPASDFLTTPAGGTMDKHFDPAMGGAPIPPGFFGPGSDPFIGTIAFHGRPLEGTPGMAPTGVGLAAQADTIVQRLTSTPPLACPGTGVVPIQMVALSLVSVAPISVSFGGGTSTSTYEVMVCASSTAVQPTGQMQILRNNINGGVFSSTLPVIPRFIFTRCSGTSGVAQAIMDPGPTVNLGTNQGTWSSSPLGLDILNSPPGTVDHDCNAATPPVPYPPTSNFFPGVSAPGSTCAVSGPSPQKMLTSEQEMLAAHGVLPPCRPPGVGYCFGTAAACPCGNAGAIGHGCETSLGNGGGLLYGSGEAKTTADTLVLRVENIGEGTPVLVYQGTVAAAVVFGDGLRCITGAGIKRFMIKFSRCGKVNHGAPVGDPPVHVTGMVPPPGGVFLYQGWFRNAPVFCTVFTFNLTNGYQVTWVP